ncbi:hypothetical protein HK101_005462 [Irineochytrium annulatum]|nr:hypothetical protein HK101_005462 [Irineochytrium annulatum]
MDNATVNGNGVGVARHVGIANTNTDHLECDGNDGAFLSALTPDLRSQLVARHEGVLGHLVSLNGPCKYFQSSNLLSRFRNAIKDELPTATTPDRPRDPSADARLNSLFSSSVPLSTYDDYKSLIHDAFFADSPCLQSKCENLLSPGLPYYIAHSSATSNKSPKFFPKYVHANSEEYDRMIKNGEPKDEGGKSLVTFSMKYSRLLECVDDVSAASKSADGAPVVPPSKRILPVCVATTGAVRIARKLPVEYDAFIRKMKSPTSAVPMAVAYVSNYRTVLLLNALFAISDRDLTLINTVFATIFGDLAKLMQDNWDMLVISIEEGCLPALEGIEDVEDDLMLHWKADPGRAGELRALDVRSEGWMKRCWPRLARVACTCSGTFETVVPVIRHCVGPDVELSAVGFSASECVIGVPFNNKDLNLYKVVGSDDLIEYLPVVEEEEERELDANGVEIEPAVAPTDVVRSYEVEAGRRYEIVLTTRDGFWRYRLGDVIEIAGFDPVDGQPLMRYRERKNMAIRLMMAMVTESELHAAIRAASRILGGRVEFTLVADQRHTLKALGFLLEVDSPEPLDPNSPECVQARRELCRVLEDGNSNYRGDIGGGRLLPATLRFLKRGTLLEFRQVKVKKSNSGVGQTKVPVVVMDEENREWLLERVASEVPLAVRG